MGKYLVRRLLWSVVVLFFVCLITFVIAYAVPGDAAKSMAGPHATPEVLQRVRQEVAVLQPPALNRMAHTFSHIFSGGYAAGYYSYKWAEVLSADAYAAFEETQGADGQPSLETGRRYRREILETGGSRPAMQSFTAFRGREPQLDALLRHQGMHDLPA